jgi:hypothetical protein
MGMSTLKLGAFLLALTVLLGCTEKPQRVLREGASAVDPVQSPLRERALKQGLQ